MATMVPLDPAAVWYVRSWLGPPEGPGLLALHHALAYRPPGLWGDDPASPRGVLLVREGAGRVEAFGAGAAEAPVAWLLRARRPFTLHAPDDWYEAVRQKLGADSVGAEVVETWGGPGLSVSRLPPGGRAGTFPRRLTYADAAAFAASVPPWALRGWRSYRALVENAVAFGVPHGGGFASCAWVFDRADCYDALGVFTVPRFRRLGLGRAAAASVVNHLVRERGHVPLWTTRPGNEPSRALARALGFSVAAEETLLRWPAGEEGEER